MKIYDENQFTKSKLDERERGDTLGLEAFDITKAPAFKKSKTIKWEKLKKDIEKVISTIESKNIEEYDDGRWFNLKIPTSYGLCTGFITGTIGPSKRAYINFQIKSPYIYKASNDPKRVFLNHSNTLTSSCDITEKQRFGVECKLDEKTNMYSTYIQVEDK